MQSRAEMLQHPIAVAMAQSVVDLLESIEVDYEEGELDLAVSLPPRNHPLHVLPQQRAIGQACQGIVRRLVFQFFHSPPPLGDVGDDGEPGGLSREIHFSDRHLHIHVAPVLAAVSGA